MKKNKITAVLGPTNTGKTFLAIETMLSFETGMMGFPLRLLAREVYDKVIKKVGLNKNEVMILASIINQESKKESELPTIAGVYINRLKNNWKLQADPTVIYAAYKLDEYKNTVIRRVLNKHLKRMLKIFVDY